ncbi:acetylcholine receptor subunit alpha-like 1 [Symsagittifera roscoffensis]|uniref:acetylcholine receptor subunit alpha-like 1 n=1 Tax=Symsagittifera roscoffensis TaxID=84072 RepID=UPI00307C8531
MDLFQILNVDVKNGVGEIKFFLYVYYTSPSAAWDPSLYGDGSMDIILVPAGTFWSPDIVMLQTTEQTYSGFSRQGVYSNGTVVAYSSLLTMKMSCAFDVSKFPADQQTCQLKATQFLSTSSNYRMAVEASFWNAESEKYELPLDNYMINDQWILEFPAIMATETRIWNGNILNGVISEIRIRRRPEFFTAALIFPFAALYFLSSLTFFIPVESGEKVSFAVTVLLAQMVIFGSLLDMLPFSSVNLPLAIKTMRLVFVHLSANCLSAVLVFSSANPVTQQPGQAPPYAQSNFGGGGGMQLNESTQKLLFHPFPSIAHVGGQPFKIYDERAPNAGSEVLHFGVQQPVCQCGAMCCLLTGREGMAALSDQSRSLIVNFSINTHCICAYYMYGCPQAACSWCPGSFCWPRYKLDVQGWNTSDVHLQSMGAGCCDRRNLNYSVTDAEGRQLLYTSSTGDQYVGNLFYEMFLGEGRRAATLSRLSDDMLALEFTTSASTEEKRLITGAAAAIATAHFIRYVPIRRR